MCEHEKKAEARTHVWVGPGITIFKCFVSILLNENRTKSENERDYMYELKRKGEKIIVVMASQLAMKELGFSPDTSPVVAHPGTLEGRFP